MPLTPSFLWDLESNMRTITNHEYERLQRKLWWRDVMKVGPKSGSKRERVTWLLDTARIRDTDYGGHIPFEDIVAQTTEVEFTNAASGLKIKKEHFEDIDGQGIDYATHWSRQIGAYAAYWPQKKLAQSIRANSTTYDGLSFFHAAHPVNPFKTSAGTYGNILTGAASGAYPGALPIHNNTPAEAVDNIAKAIAYVSQFKLPNGEDPRFLKLAKIIVPPKLLARAQQITNAKYVAQVAATGVAAGGSGDIEAVVSNWGLGQPIEAVELSSAFTGNAADDNTYYLVMEEITSSELGAFMWIPREDFAVQYYGPQTDAQLARVRELHWYTEGRYGLMFGHPYMLIKCTPT